MFLAGGSLLIGHASVHRVDREYHQAGEHRLRASEELARRIVAGDTPYGESLCIGEPLEQRCCVVLRRLASHEEGSQRGTGHAEDCENATLGFSVSYWRCAPHLRAHPQSALHTNSSHNPYRSVHREVHVLVGVEEEVGETLLERLNVRVGDDVLQESRRSFWIENIDPKKSDPLFDPSQFGVSPFRAKMAKFEPKLPKRKSTIGDTCSHGGQIRIRRDKF